MTNRMSDSTDPVVPLSRLLAESMAAQIRAIHPQADAIVLYCFGSGGYVVVARSPLPGQDDVALLNVAAYRTFLNLRADAWKRRVQSANEERRMAERVEEAAMADLLLADEREGW